MGLKIKWNDDRVRGATTAILLISRDRLHRGETDDLIQASLTEYRADPEGYKARKAAWADARELGPLTKTLKEMTGMSVREIAELLGKSSSTVQYHLTKKVAARKSRKKKEVQHA